MRPLAIDSGDYVTLVYPVQVVLHYELDTHRKMPGLSDENCTSNYLTIAWYKIENIYFIFFGRINQLVYD